MGCPCASVSAKKSSGIAKVLHNYLQKGESIECASARDDDADEMQATPPTPDRIKNNSVSANCEMKMDETFVLTEGSLSAAYQSPPKYELKIKDDQGAEKQPSDLGLTFDGTSGKLSGTIKDEFEKKTLTFTVKAIDANNKEIDERTYNMAAKKCNGNELTLINPLPGSVKTSDYGPRAKPCPKCTDFHKGIDLAMRGGRIVDIVAAADGEVIAAVSNGTSQGYGNKVIIRHTAPDGTHLADTLYAHMSQVYVSVGQKVTSGTAIAKEGHAGVGTGNHLHFELILPNGGKTDPWPYINDNKKIESTGTNPASDNPNAPGQQLKKDNTPPKKLSDADVKAKTGCPKFENSPDGRTYNDGKSAPGDKQIIGSTAPSCRPANYKQNHPSAAEVQAKVRATADKHPELDEEDKKYLLKLCSIEGGNNPYAKNPKSSATGLYQMLNGTSGEYYAKAGIEPTCENRCDPEKSTEAMIIMLKEEKQAYTTYKANGTIGGKAVQNNSNTAIYQNATKGEFMYMIHGQGFGGMRKGTDNAPAFLRHYRTHATDLS
jgi:murein DD-endopeptidase MepM/ murein hydrolase activator NlpD